jgi:Protein of unknown function (DUF2752)
VPGQPPCHNRIAYADDVHGPSALRASSWVAPTVVGVAGLGAVAYVALVDPAEGAVQLGCPFHAATGLWCPGCGLTRATHHLLHGDVAGALSRNAMMPVVLGVVVWAWLAWWWGAVSRRSVPRPSVIPVAAWMTAVAAALAFGVARNLAPLSALAP